AEIRPEDGDRVVPLVPVRPFRRGAAVGGALPGVEVDVERAADREVAAAKRPLVVAAVPVRPRRALSECFRVGGADLYGSAGRICLERAAICAGTRIRARCTERRTADVEA